MFLFCRYKKSYRNEIIFPLFLIVMYAIVYVYTMYIIFIYVIIYVNIYLYMLLYNVNVI